MTLAQSWSITTTAAYGRKAPKNNCTKYIGQSKSGKSADFCVTKPNFANMLPLLPSFALGSALLDQVIYTNSKNFLALLPCKMEAILSIELDISYL